MTRSDVWKFIDKYKKPNRTRADVYEQNESGKISWNVIVEFNGKKNPDRRSIEFNIKEGDSTEYLEKKLKTSLAYFYKE